MQLAVSNIAWTNEEEPLVAQMLQRLGIKKIELAPTKRWENPTSVSAEEASEYREWWSQFDIEIVAFQSMLFARPYLKIFESSENRADCLHYLQDFIVLAGQMGVKKMVFGSPKNRQRGNMSYEEAFIIAKDFFTDIAKTAEKNNVIFCLEPNAPQYNCDFVTNAREGADLVRVVAHSNFRLHLDTACMALGKDDATVAIKESADILRYFHISAPMLDRVYDREDIDYRKVASVLNEISYEGVVSIEMRPDESGGNAARVEEAVISMRSIFHSN